MLGSVSHIAISFTQDFSSKLWITKSMADSIHTDTEIDWKAYMEQVALYISGERDYEVFNIGFEIMR